MTSVKMKIRNNDLRHNMRGTVAKSLRKTVYLECAKIAHAFPSRVLRRVKKAYMETPRPRRKNFNPRIGESY